MAKEHIVIFHHDERGAVRTWSDMGELLRCKDCRHYDTHGHRCKVWNHGVADDGFCYKGEQE